MKKLIKLNTNEIDVVSGGFYGYIATLLLSIPVGYGIGHLIHKIYKQKYFQPYTEYFETVITKGNEAIYKLSKIENLSQEARDIINPIIEKTEATNDNTKHNSTHSGEAS